MKKTSSLASFTSLALALPGIAPSAEITQPQVDYQFSYYDESDDRMTVKAHQVRAALPLESVNLQLDLVKDIVTGASPNFNLPDRKGIKKPTQILSGASIKEERDVVNFNLTKTFEAVDLSLGTGYSSENDYQSTSFSSELGYAFNKKNSRVNLGWSLSLDDISRTGAPLDENKRSVNYLIGFSQLLSPKASVAFSLSYAQHRGYLSDPYKHIFIEKKGLSGDIRPESRYQTSLQVDYKRYLSKQLALKLSYRYYQDNWQVCSHTITLATPIQLPSDWILRPSLRYYSQTKADFYQSFFQNEPTRVYQTSDYRLAGFGAYSPELKLTKQFKGFNFNMALRYYKADHRYKLGANADFLPGALSFYLFNIGITAQF